MRAYNRSQAQWRGTKLAHQQRRKDTQNQIRFNNKNKTLLYYPSLPRQLHHFSTAHRSQHLASSATTSATSATVSTAMVTTMPSTITTVSMTMSAIMTMSATTYSSISPYICGIRHSITLIRTPRRALIHTATSAVITQLTGICIFGRIIDWASSTGWL